jgi:predicted DNA-binding transcriptional regulator AlpA
MAHTQDTTRRMVSLTELEMMIGATRKTIMSWIKAGRFPPPAPALGRGGKQWWNRAQVERALEGGPPVGGKKR